MEASSTLKIESFSYRWLINLKSTIGSPDDSLEPSDESAFIVMDPKMTPSKRFLGDALDFNFPTTTTTSTTTTTTTTQSHSDNPTLVHAEELFSNGFLLPIFLNKNQKSKIEPIEDNFDSITNSSSLPITPKSSKTLISINETHSSLAKKCWRSSKRIFRKYFVKPVNYLKKQGSLKSSRSASLIDNSNSKWEDSENKMMIRSSSCNYQPTRRSYDSIGEVCDAEESIYEAVLHCKKSIGK